MKLTHGASKRDLTSHPIWNRLRLTMKDVAAKPNVLNALVKCIEYFELKESPLSKHSAKVATCSRCQQDTHDLHHCDAENDMAKIIADHRRMPLKQLKVEMKMNIRNNLKLNKLFLHICE